MPTDKSNSFVALALAGIVSGFLTCASGRFLELFGPPGRNMFTYVGAIFGFVLVVYWWIFQGFRSTWRSVGFILSCTVAFALAEAAGMNAPLFLAFFSSVDRHIAREIEICFTGGVVGGGIVFLSAVFLLPNRTQWRYVPLYVAFCFVSGVLGATAWMLGPYLGTAIWHVLKATRFAEQYEYSQSQPSGGANNFYSLFVLWQACIAPLLGFVLARPGLLLGQQRKGLAASSTFVSEGDVSPGIQMNRAIPSLAGVFFACVLGFLGYLVVRTVKSERLASKRSAAYSRALAEAPPIVGAAVRV